MTAGIILYFIIPLDIIPDFLPLVGVADELTLFYFMFLYLLKKYEQPSSAHGQPVIDAEVIE